MTPRIYKKWTEEIYRNIESITATKGQFLSVFDPESEV